MKRNTFKYQILSFLFLGVICSEEIRASQSLSFIEVRSCPSIHGKSASELRLDLSKLAPAPPEYHYEGFDILGVLPGRHGGRLVVIQRKPTWFDLIKELNPRLNIKVGDFVPDIRTNLMLLGTEGAAFFGYKLLDDNTATLPDVDELNGAILKFNEGLEAHDPRRILILGYKIRKVTNPLRDYLGRFSSEGKIPISSMGKGFFHDISAHGLEGFFVDNRLVQVAQRRTAFLLSLGNFLETHFATSMDIKFLRRLNIRVYEKMVDLIDSIGGIGPQFLRPEQRRELAETSMSQTKMSYKDGRYPPTVPDRADVLLFRLFARVVSLDSGEFRWARADLKSEILAAYGEYVSKSIWAGSDDISAQEFREKLQALLQVYFKEHEGEIGPGFDFETDLALMSPTGRDIPILEISLLGNLNQRVI